MTKISVIIPIYNVEEYLARSLESIINQTLSDIEIICINDCSTDNSLAVLNKLALKDSRIKIIDLKENKGAAIARNEGLKIAKGEFLGFIDPDDTVDLNFYEELYKKAIETESDMVKCQRKVYALDGSCDISNINEQIRKFGKYYFTYEWTTAIYKSELVFGNNIAFPEECTKAQDVVFLSRCIINCKKLALIDGVFYNYIKRKGSLHSSKIPLKSVISALRAQELIAQNYNNSNLFDENKEIYTVLYSSVISTILNLTFNQNDEKEAKMLCVNKAIEIYFKSKDINALCARPAFYFLKKHFEDKDADALFEILSKTTMETLIQRGIIKQLKDNVKKDLITK